MRGKAIAEHHIDRYSSTPLRTEIVLNQLPFCT
jgi:hypothetical protein